MFTRSSSPASAKRSRPGENPSGGSTPPVPIPTEVAAADWQHDWQPSDGGATTELLTSFVLNHVIFFELPVLPVKAAEQLVAVKASGHFQENHNRIVLQQQTVRQHSNVNNALGNFLGRFMDQKNLPPELRAAGVDRLFNVFLAIYGDRGEGEKGSGSEGGAGSSSLDDEDEVDSESGTIEFDEGFHYDKISDPEAVNFRAKVLSRAPLPRPPARCPHFCPLTASTMLRARPL